MFRHGEFDPKGRSRIKLARHRYRTAMEVQNLTSNKQAKAQPAEAACADGTLEAAEYPFLVFIRDSHPVVFDNQGGIVICE